MSDTITVYSVSSIAAALGVTRSSVAKARLPEPDVIMRSGGKSQYGWGRETLTEWARNSGRDLDPSKL